MEISIYLPCGMKLLKVKKQLVSTLKVDGWVATLQEKLNKMKTFKDKNPIHSQLDRKVIDICLQQQQEILDLLKLSESKSLQAIRIPTTLSKWIRMNAGDTFHFIIQHNLRHLKQMHNIFR